MDREGRQGGRQAEAGQSGRLWQEQVGQGRLERRMYLANKECVRYGYTGGARVGRREGREGRREGREGKGRGRVGGNGAV